RPELTPDQVKKILIDSATKESGKKREDSGAPGALDLKEAIKTKTPHHQQTWPRATGTGSLEAASGSTRVELDGVVLEGEFDIFGSSWTGSSWTGSSWTGSSWTGSTWL
ncbi:MAG: peptidase S8 and S53 subtilisin kexin sedolisin, partial [Acidimicrobiia bacterium]